eukprot:g533.t1
MSSLLESLKNGLESSSYPTQYNAFACTSAASNEALSNLVTEIVSKHTDVLFLLGKAVLPRPNQYEQKLCFNTCHFLFRCIDNDKKDNTDTEKETRPGHLLALTLLPFVWHSYLLARQAEEEDIEREDKDDAKKSYAGSLGPTHTLLEKICGATTNAVEEGTGEGDLLENTFSLFLSSLPSIYEVVDRQSYNIGRITLSSFALLLVGTSPLVRLDMRLAKHISQTLETASDYFSPFHNGDTEPKHMNVKLHPVTFSSQQFSNVSLRYCTLIAHKILKYHRAESVSYEPSFDTLRNLRPSENTFASKCSPETLHFVKSFLAKRDQRASEYRAVITSGKDTSTKIEDSQKENLITIQRLYTTVLSAVEFVIGQRSSLSTLRDELIDSGDGKSRDTLQDRYLTSALTKACLLAPR